MKTGPFGSAAMLEVVRAMDIVDPSLAEEVLQMIEGDRRQYDDTMNKMYLLREILLKGNPAEIVRRLSPKALDNLHELFEDGEMDRDLVSETQALVNLGLERI
jgi:hypothetical protein